MRSVIRELSEKLNRDLLTVAQWMNEHKLTLNLEKTKCILIGSNRKPESKVPLTVSILDHKVDNVSSFKYLGIFISSDFKWTHHIEHIVKKVNQRLGLLKRVKHLLPFKSRLLYYNSIVMPLFDYADLVWGDKHNLTLMSSLQTLQNKAAKLILDRPLYSSASDALTTLNWVSLEKRRYQRRCVYVYKCLNGLVNHDMDLLRHEDQHTYNTRNKDKLRIPIATRQWGQQRTAFQAVNDFNSLNPDIKQSANVAIFKRNILKLD